MTTTTHAVDARSIPPETRAELGSLASEIVSLNAYARDLLHACPVHAGSWDGGCRDCQPFLETCRRINEKQHEYSLTLAGAQMRLVAASWAKVDEPESKVPWWRRWFRRG